MPKIKPIKTQLEAPECPMQRTMQFIAGAWTPEIIWYLQGDPRRFRDLQRDLNGVSAKVLTTRLRELEENGVIVRKVFPTKPPTVEYSLTELGQKFQPILDSIAKMGAYLCKNKKTCATEEAKKKKNLQTS